VRAGASAAPLEALLDAEASAIKAMQADRQLITTLVDLHDGILEIAGSKTLLVVWKLLDEVVGPYSLTSLRSFGGQEDRIEAVKRSHTSHKALVRAIAAGDGDKAERIMRTHLEAVREATASVAKLRMVDMFA